MPPCCATNWRAFLPCARTSATPGMLSCASLARSRASAPGLTTPPADAEVWLAILRSLTRDFPGDEPWHLVSPPEAPAFLQAPVPGGRLDGFKPLATPDELDMLVTSKNHDLKGARLVHAAPDDWMFALVALQTMEGFLGAGNYGIARMNGGFANRPGLSMAPDGGPGAHVARDMRRLLELREDVLDHYDYSDNGLALLWLTPWDGTTSLSPTQLDPYFIEICRRVRLVETDGAVSARVTGSKAPRVKFSEESAGNTGDPWAPLETTNGRHQGPHRGRPRLRLSPAIGHPRAQRLRARAATDDRSGRGAGSSLCPRLSRHGPRKGQDGRLA